MNNKRLYQGLADLGLMYDPAVAVVYSGAQEYYGGFLWGAKWFCGMPEDFQKRYRLCVALNGMKFTLAMENFEKPRDWEAISAATCFILAGCLLDHLIDEGISEDRALALEKLDWEYCAHYFVRFGPARSEHTVDMLYGVIGAFLRERKHVSTAAYHQLISHLRRAIQAETADKKSIGEDRELVVDKSVLFVVIGFELAMYGDHTQQEWETFFLIGDIFRIIDDLCDAEQDARVGHMNSLLSGQELTDLPIDKTLSDLGESLEQLKALVSEPFYEFIRYEIQSWTLSNAYLFNKITEGIPCPTL